MSRNNFRKINRKKGDSTKSNQAMQINFGRYYKSILHGMKSDIILYCKRQVGSREIQCQPNRCSHFVQSIWASCGTLCTWYLMEHTIIFKMYLEVNNQAPEVSVRAAWECLQWPRKDFLPTYRAYFKLFSGTD